MPSGVAFDLAESNPMTFGKRNRPPDEPPRPPRQSSDMVPLERFPWEPHGTIRANFAIGDLSELMMQWLKSERGIHAETLMVVIGAVTGFAAQNVVWQMVNEPGMRLPPDGLVTATVGSEKFYFGDLINGQLVGDAGHPYRLWNVVVAAAAEAGMPPSERPDLGDIFRHVASTVGKPEFGIPRVPKGNSPHYMPRQALDRFWPHVKFILTRTDRSGPARGQSVVPEHWPIVLSLVARQFVQIKKSVLDPRLAVQLIMELAIAMSKVDPKTVPQELPKAS